MNIFNTLLTSIFISTSSFASTSHTYKQTLIVTSFINLQQTISSGDDVDASPTEYWLEANIKNGFGIRFFCGTDWDLCRKVEFELDRNLRDHSKALNVLTTETFVTPAKDTESEKRCSYRYEHLTNLDSGREIQLIETSHGFTCAPPGQSLPCNPARYALVKHPSGWSYCVWVGVK